MTDLPIHDMTVPHHEHRWIMSADVVPHKSGDGVYVQTRILCMDENCEAVKDVESKKIPERNLTEEEFFDEFHPDNNGGSYYSFLAVEHVDPHYVWSIVEGGHDGNLYALPGFHMVNQIDYVLCTKPWTEDIGEAMYMDRKKNFEEE